MDYLHTHSDATIRHRASNLILYIKSDAAYLVLPKYHSRSASVFFLGDRCAPGQRPTINGIIDVLFKTIKNVFAFAVKAETAAIFLNAQHAIQILTALLKLGHIQPAEGTLVSTDNSAARGILTSSLCQKLSKAFDMRYWWMRDRIKQTKINLVWEPRKSIPAYYFSKHIPPRHHKSKLPIYIQPRQTANCVTNIIPRGFVTPWSSMQHLVRPTFHSFTNMTSHPWHTCSPGTGQRILLAFTKWNHSLASWFI